MFKKNFFLLLAVMMSLASSAAEKKSSLPKLAPPPIIMNFAKERHEVTATGEFSSLPVSVVSKGKVKAPASSAAALLTEKGRLFTWKPSPLMSNTLKNADLTGAVLSADGTLAVLTERIGGENNPNSTRFVLFNIPEQCIARGFILKEVLIDSAAFIPGSKTEMIAIRRSSSFFNTRSALVRISLRNKEIMDYIAADWRLDSLVANMPQEYMDYIVELIDPPFEVVRDADKEMIIFLIRARGRAI